MSYNAMPHVEALEQHMALLQDIALVLQPIIDFEAVVADARQELVNIRHRVTYTLLNSTTIMADRAALRNQLDEAEFENTNVQFKLDLVTHENARLQKELDEANEELDSTRNHAHFVEKTEISRLQARVTEMSEVNGELQDTVHGLWNKAEALSTLVLERGIPYPTGPFMPPSPPEEPVVPQAPTFSEHQLPEPASRNPSSPRRSAHPVSFHEPVERPCLSDRMSAPLSSPALEENENTRDRQPRRQFTMNDVD